MNVDWKKHKFVCLWEDCHDPWEQLCHHLVSSAWTGCLQKNSSQRCWTHLQRLFRILGYFTNNVQRSCAIYFGFGFISGQQEIDNVSLQEKRWNFHWICMFFTCNPFPANSIFLSFPILLQGFPKQGLGFGFGFWLRLRSWWCGVCGGPFEGFQLCPAITKQQRKVLQYWKDLNPQIWVPGKYLGLYGN